MASSSPNVSVTIGEAAFYPLPREALAGVLDEFRGPDALMRQLRPLLSRGDAVLQVNGETLAPVDALDDLFGDYGSWRQGHEAS